MMRFDDLIFSKNIAVRVCRHVAFWLVIYMILVIGSASVDMGSEWSAGEHDTTLKIISALTLYRWQDHSIFALMRLMVDIPYCYILVYYVIPPLLSRRKYGRLLLAFLLLTLVAVCITAYIDGFSFQLSGRDMLIQIFFIFVVLVNIGAPVICGLFFAIKMLTNWYVKEKERVDLVRENARAELRLLQAQVHPHFLFNTLNNIYSFTLNRSPVASALVTRLSAVIDYMVHDCDSSSVPVDREIKMVEDYIALEKVRYGDRLDLQMKIEGNTVHKNMAPFLLIPFIENSFKHGASEVLERPWIKLNVMVSNQDLLFQLCNSKPSHAIATSPGGIGLGSVKKRLQLLYPENHELDFVVEETSFSVKMRVPLNNPSGSENGRK